MRDPEDEDDGEYDDDDKVEEEIEEGLLFSKGFSVVVSSETKFINFSWLLRDIYCSSGLLA